MLPKINTSDIHVVTDSDPGSLSLGKFKKKKTFNTPENTRVMAKWNASDRMTWKEAKFTNDEREKCLNIIMEKPIWKRGMGLSCIL